MYLSVCAHNYVQYLDYIRVHCTYICEIILKSRTNIRMHTCVQLPFLKSLHLMLSLNK